MLVKNIIDEDFINYKKQSMFIIFPYCSFKCNKENGNQICQNSNIANLRNIDISYKDIVDRYMMDTITRAIVFGGLEPFDSWQDCLLLIRQFREVTKDEIIIYTGYTEDECVDYINWLKMFDNIIIKFGRYLRNQKPHYDDIIGVNLASDNQYAVKIS